MAEQTIDAPKSRPLRLFRQAGLLALLIPLLNLLALAQLPKITGKPPRGPLKPFMIDMMATHHPDSGVALPPIIFHDTLVRTSWHGRSAMRRETATTKPGGKEFVLWAIVIFDATTLVPYYSEIRRKDGLFVRHEFNGVHVKETRTTADVLRSPPLKPGEPVNFVTTEFDLPEPAFTWIENTGLPILLSLPLQDGFEGSVPVISGDSSAMKPCMAGPCFVLRMSYRVRGIEDKRGISDVPIRSWKISVPETGFTFWIARKGPRLVQVYWPGPGGNGTFSMGPVPKSY